jgi:hypothetical protein
MTNQTQTSTMNIHSMSILAETNGDIKAKYIAKGNGTNYHQLTYSLPNSDNQVLVSEMQIGHATTIVFDILPYYDNCRNIVVDANDLKYKDFVLLVNLLIQIVAFDSISSVEEAFTYAEKLLQKKAAPSGIGKVCLPAFKDAKTKKEKYWFGQFAQMTSMV